MTIVITRYYYYRRGRQRRPTTARSASSSFYRQHGRRRCPPQTTTEEERERHQRSLLLLLVAKGIVASATVRPLCCMCSLSSRCSIHRQRPQRLLRMHHDQAHQANPRARFIDVGLPHLALRTRRRLPKQPSREPVNGWSKLGHDSSDDSRWVVP